MGTPNAFVQTDIPQKGHKVVMKNKATKKDIESIGFVVNPFDICVANKIVDGKEQTITWHINDIKASHVDPK
eukprot:11939119-Ditylum_brightwellii.AAC.1